jgi:hypothetical protein
VKLRQCGAGPQSAARQKLREGLFAAARQRRKGMPTLFRYQKNIETELFSKKNLANASVAELSKLWKSVRENIAVDISVLKNASATSGRPRIKGECAASVSARCLIVNREKS